MNPADLPCKPHALATSGGDRGTFDGRTENRLTPEQVGRWVDAYRACHGGDFPSNRSGPIPGANRTWQSVAAAMRAGCSGWQDKTSLAAWLDQRYPERTNGVRMTPAFVRQCVDDYRARHGGEFPMQRSGPIPGTGKTWATMWMSVPNQRDGWPDGITLGAWLDEQYPERTVGRIDKLTPELVREWVDQYRASHGGKFPSSKSGAIPGTDKTWAAVDGAMMQCGSGWPRATSLPGWLDEQYPERVRKITPELVRHWVDDHRARHDGRFPTNDSGRIPGTTKTWAAVRVAMAKCVAGWTQKTTLSAWLDAHYPERLKQRPPPSGRTAAGCRQVDDH